MAACPCTEVDSSKSTGLWGSSASAVEYLPQRVEQWEWKAVHSLTGRRRTDHCTRASAATPSCMGGAEADVQTGPGLSGTALWRRARAEASRSHHVRESSLDPKCCHFKGILMGFGVNVRAHLKQGPPWQICSTGLYLSDL